MTREPLQKDPIKRKKKATPPKTSGKEPEAALQKRAWQRLTTTQKRIVAASGAVLVLTAGAWIFWGGSPAKVPGPGASTGTKTVAPGSVFDQPAALPPAPPREEATVRSWIQAIRLEPARPTRADTLKADIVLAASAPERMRYLYRWKVNGRAIEDAEGNTLNLAAFKKRDLVTVTITPYDGDEAGFAVESPVVAVHAVPPGLHLKNLRIARRPGVPVELDLVGAAPDGGQVMYSLEAPVVPGMTIDRQTGKIVWTLQPDQKGTIRFGAAVEDEDRNKVVKVFDVKLD